uniref:Uncharacterized protein n=1 Tax=Dulem virus 32 TaxID=3145750 RepID=A0AAU8B0P8_9CAUD
MVLPGGLGVAPRHPPSSASRRQRPPGRAQTRCGP